MDVQANGVIIACRFHLGQSQFTKIQELSLATAYTRAEGELGCEPTIIS